MDRILTRDIQLAIMKARTLKKMSQADLAKQAKVHESVIKAYENGTANPNNEFIVKLESILGIKIPHAKKKKTIE